jgi:hypothetical protein
MASGCEATPRWLNRRCCRSRAPCLVSHSAHLPVSTVLILESPDQSWRRSGTSQPTTALRRRTRAAYPASAILPRACPDWAPRDRLETRTIDQFELAAQRPGRRTARVSRYSRSHGHTMSALRRQPRLGRRASAARRLGSLSQRIGERHPEPPRGEMIDLDAPGNYPDGWANFSSSRYRPRPRFRAGQVSFCCPVGADPTRPPATGGSPPGRPYRAQDGCGYGACTGFAEMHADAAHGRDSSRGR